MRRILPSLVAAFLLAPALGHLAMGAAALVPRSLDVLPSDPREGDTLGFWLWLENTGDARAVAASAHFTFDGIPIAEPPCVQSDGVGTVRAYREVPAGGTIGLYCQISNAGAGTHTVTAGGLLRTFTVGPAPSPEPLPFVESDASPRWAPAFLWHRSADRATDGSGWYYGVENGPGFDDNSYEYGMNGGAHDGPYYNEGALVSPPVDLTTVAGASLAYSTRWDGWLGSAGLGNPVVEARRVGDAAWTRIVDRAVAEGSGEKVVDLTAFAGSVVRIRLVWKAVSEPSSDLEGWYVDGLRIVEGSATPRACATPGPDPGGYTCEVRPFTTLRGPSREGLRGSVGEMTFAAHVAGPGYRVVPLDFPFPFYGRYFDAVGVHDRGILELAGDPVVCSTPEPCFVPAIDAFAGDFPYLTSPGFFGPAGMAVRGCADEGLLCVDFEWVRVQYLGHHTGPESSYTVRLRQDGAIFVAYERTHGDGAPHDLGIQGARASERLVFLEGDPDLDRILVAYLPPALSG